MPGCASRVFFPDCFHCVFWKAFFSSTPDSIAAAGSVQLQCIRGGGVRL